MDLASDLKSHFPVIASEDEAFGIKEDRRVIASRVHHAWKLWKSILVLVRIIEPDTAHISSKLVRATCQYYFILELGECKIPLDLARMIDILNLWPIERDNSKFFEVTEHPYVEEISPLDVVTEDVRMSTINVCPATSHADSLGLSWYAKRSVDENFKLIPAVFS